MIVKLFLCCVALNSLRTVVKFLVIGKLKQDNNLWNIPSTQLQSYNIKILWKFLIIKKIYSLSPGLKRKTLENFYLV